MEKRLNIRYLAILVLSFLFTSPFATQASVDLESDTTFYKFEEAWIEINGEAKNSALGASLFDVATLYIKHRQINTGVERLLFIPVSVEFSSTSLVPFHLRKTWNLGMGDLRGQTLSDIFSSPRRKGMRIKTGFISHEDADEIYVIYSDRVIVEIVDLKTILDLPI